MGEVKNSWRLDGRTALITGASRGIGRSAAEALAERGAEVWLMARGPNALEDAVTALHDQGYTAHALCGDLADAASRGGVYHRTGDSGRRRVQCLRLLIGLLAPDRKTRARVDTELQKPFSRRLGGKGTWHLSCRSHRFFAETQKKRAQPGDRARRKTARVDTDTPLRGRRYSASFTQAVQGENRFSA